MADSIKVTLNDTVGSWIAYNLGSARSFVCVGFQFFLPTATQTAWLTGSTYDAPVIIRMDDGANLWRDTTNLNDFNATGEYTAWKGDNWFPYPTIASPAGSWHKLEIRHSVTATNTEAAIWYDDSLLQQNYDAFEENITDILLGSIINSGSYATADIYLGRIKIGTTDHGSDILDWDPTTAVDLSAFTVTGTAVLDTAPVALPGWGGVVDTTPPALIDLDVSGNTVTLKYDETLTTNNPDTSQFTVLADGVPVAVSAAAASGTDVTLTLARSVLVTENVKVSYTPA